MFLIDLIRPCLMIIWARNDEKFEHMKSLMGRTRAASRRDSASSHSDSLTTISGGLDRLDDDNDNDQQRFTPTSITAVDESMTPEDPVRITTAMQDLITTLSQRGVT